MEKIIKGDDLMLFDAEGKSLAFATSHQLSISADAVETSSKDGGVWAPLSPHAGERRVALCD